MSYARCYSPVTLFISGYACKHGCDVTACFPVLFYNINWKWTPCVYLTWCKNSMEFGRMWKYLCKPSPAACVNKLSNSPKLSLVFASGFINTGDHIVYFLNNNLMFVCVHTINIYIYIYTSANPGRVCYLVLPFPHHLRILRPPKQLWTWTTIKDCFSVGNVLVTLVANLQ